MTTQSPSDHPRRTPAERERLLALPRNERVQYRPTREDMPVSYWPVDMVRRMTREN